MPKTREQVIATDILNEVCEIASTGWNDHEDIRPTLKSGPNSWSQVTSEDYALTYDYTSNPYPFNATDTIIEFLSNAALQWLYAKLPEGINRFNNGFIVETKWLPMIERAMDRDHLISKAEYIESMEEQNQLQFAQDHE